MREQGSTNNQPDNVWNLHYRFKLFSLLGFREIIKDLDLNRGDEDKIVKQILGCGETTARNLINGNDIAGEGNEDDKLSFHQMKSKIGIS